MWLRRVAPFGIGLCLLACEKESASSDAPKAAESAAPKSQALDPDLAQAMAAASAKAPPGDSAGGPPANGIFAPGAADKELARGQPPKLTIGSEGSEPRVSLAPAQPKPGTKQSLNLRLSVQNAPNQGALPIDFALAFEAQKPKGEEGEIDEVPVQVKVTGARVGMTGAPVELEAQVAKLKGSKIEYLVLPNGAGTAFRSDAPKGVDPSLSDIVRSLSDVLAIVTLPVPDKPVGVGAYWMATTRDSPIGLDLVTYRLVKVVSADPKKVTLDVNTKRYAATSSFELPGLPPNVPPTMLEFQALAQGTLELEPGRGFPSGARQESVLGATLGSADAPGQRGVLEMRTRAELSADALKPTR